MKRALVLTPWALDKDGGQIPEVALLETLSPKGKVRGVPMTEATDSQRVKLPDSPNPNIVMVEVREEGNPTDWHKHDGLIEDIKKDPRFLIIREWDDQSPLITTKTPKAKVSTYLGGKGVAAHLIEDVTNEGGADITQMRKVLKGFEIGE